MLIEFRVMACTNEDRGPGYQEEEEQGWTGDDCPSFLTGVFSVLPSVEKDIFIMIITCYMFHHELELYAFAKISKNKLELGWSQP